MEIEKSILSSLTRTECIERAWKLGLKEEHFESPFNRAVFNFTQKYWYDSGRTLAPTVEVLAKEYPSFSPVENEESLDWLVSTIKDRFAYNRMQSALEEVAELAIAKDPQAVSVMEDRAAEIRRSLADRRSVANMAEDVDERRQRYEKNAQFEGAIRGAPLGLAEIDDHLKGISPGELAAYGGYSGTGKSWALAVAALGGLKLGYKPYFYSLEVSKEDMEDRLDCIWSGIAYTDFLNGTLARDERRKLYAAHDEIRDLGGVTVDNAPPEERTVSHLVNKARFAQTDYLIIDQMSHLESTRTFKDARDKYGAVARDLKIEISNSNEKTIPCLIAVQMNRASKQLGKGVRAGQDHIAESSLIERELDHAFILSQSKEEKINNVMVFDIAKTRRSGAKSWQLQWQLKNRTEFGVRMEIPDGD